MKEDGCPGVDPSHISFSPFFSFSDSDPKALLLMGRTIETPTAPDDAEEGGVPLAEADSLLLPNNEFDPSTRESWQQKSPPPFGLPFRSSSASEMDLFPHPQAMLAGAIESHTHAIFLERHYMTRTILEIDHSRQEAVSEKFNRKLEESIRAANSNRVLSYVQDAMKILNFGVGIMGGCSILCASSTTGNGVGALYGIEMTGGGLCSLGSFLLDKFTPEHSQLSSVLALGGAFFSCHGGFMGRDMLNIGENLTKYGSSALSLLQSYGLFRQTQNKIDLAEFSGALSHLQKNKKMISDALKEHYEALDISDFTAFFKAAVDIIDSINEINRKIVQKTLKG